MAKIIAAGVDTGFKNIGLGVVSFDLDTQRFELLFERYVETTADMLQEQRLAIIDREVTAMAQQFNPHCSYVENFFAHQIRRKRGGVALDPNAPAMYMAMGVIMLALKNHKPSRVNPQEAKKAVTGSNKSDKDQVTKGVERILHLNYRIDNEHVSDALALAIARIIATPIYKRIGAVAHLPLMS